MDNRFNGFNCLLPSAILGVAATASPGSPAGL